MKRDVDEIAEFIVDDLFRTGNGEVASRLVLELPDGGNGGGWSKAGARSRIKDILEAEVLKA